MILDVGTWLQTMWPTRRAAVAQEYAALGQLKLLLADIALRGAAFGPLAAPGAPDSLFFVNEGRRQLALELIKLAGEDPARLFALVERGQPKKDRA